MIHAVLFDLDGTLLDRDASIRLFIEAQYDRLAGWVGHIPKKLYTERFITLDAHGYVWKDKVYRTLISEFEITGISADELLADYVTNFREYCVPFTGLEKMLGKLQHMNVRLGMITNGRTAFQLGNIRALGIEEVFDVLLVSEQEGLKKPDPRIFQKALRMLDVSPEASCFVGDHPLNDVLAAQAVGMKGIWKENDQWHEGSADFVIKNLEELSGMIERLKEKCDC
ncbi:HAD family hydrolase [Planococcus lenghuensis]|uniref:L-2-haloalkanoic acid dehalogenase n=1 Tax=Planococcus lenghuensis TaxID=2213202 RepID=A0A1Q2KWL1_9BACL|nr:HAD family hydrolase [Planococcus lenghuensis]AQQ52581.1 L-2-haloalkanoic acid dehalogenase [Planococcus lenghuensis]